MSADLEGLLLIDKPAGPTSHDVVARVRRVTGQRRVGHAGTLDPPATGLLPLVLGRATRLVRFLPASPKLYTGRLRLGRVTSTDDATGETLRVHDGPLPDAGRVLECAARLTGELLQRPPAVSARKVGGQRLYRLARRGRAVEAPAARVRVIRFELRPAEPPGLWAFEAEVTTGTYVRALARDLGELLGCGGSLDELRRVAIGPLDVRDAVAAPDLDGLERGPLLEALLPVAAMPLEPPPVELLDPDAVRGFLSGSAVSAPGSAAPTGLHRVLDGSGSLLGVAEAGDGLLRPRVVLPR